MRSLWSRKDVNVLIKYVAIEQQWDEHELRVCKWANSKKSFTLNVHCSSMMIAVVAHHFSQICLWPVFFSFLLPLPLLLYLPRSQWLAIARVLRQFCSSEIGKWCRQYHKKIFEAVVSIEIVLHWSHENVVEFFVFVFLFHFLSFEKCMHSTRFCTPEWCKIKFPCDVND